MRHLTFLVIMWDALVVSFVIALGLSFLFLSFLFWACKKWNDRNNGKC